MKVFQGHAGYGNYHPQFHMFRFLGFGHNGSPAEEFIASTDLHLGVSEVISKVHECECIRV